MVASPTSDQRGGTRGLVVLCCADENLLELAPVVEGLGKLALRVELVSGVDLDSTLVNSAAAKFTDAALWVLCQSEALDAFQVGRLESNLTESGVASAKVMTAEVDSNTPTALVDMISQAAPDHAAAIGGAYASAGASVSNASRPAGQTGPSPTIGALLGDDLPPALPDEELVPASSGSKPLYIAAGVAGVLVVVVGVALFARARAGQAEDPQPVADVTPTETTPEEALPPTPVADTDGTINADEAFDELDGAVHEAEAIDTDGAAEAADTDGALLDGEIVGDTDGEIDGQAADEALDPDAVIAEALGEDPNAPDAATPDGTTTPEEQALIDDAIRDRAIRSLDILLVHPQRSRRKSYKKAREWCEEKEVAGVGNWRLPTIGEIRTVSEARLVPRDYYWTHTAADTFGDQLLVFNGKRNRIVPKTARWSGGRAVCVRTRDGAPAVSEDTSDPNEE